MAVEIFYSRSVWTEDKIMIGRLIHKQEYAKARMFLNSIYQLVCNNVNNRDIMYQVIGMLFVIELIPNKR